MKKNLIASCILFLSLLVGGCGTIDNHSITKVTPLPKTETDQQSAEQTSKETLSPTKTTSRSIRAFTTAPFVTVVHSVPTPVYDQDLAHGESLKEAYTKDTEWRFKELVSIPDERPVTLSFDDFFSRYDSEQPYQTPELSEKLISLDGERIIIEGYMAPPLKLGLDWFMLTRMPVASCGYCASAEDWTPNMILVYVRGDELPYMYNPLRVEGELHVGPLIDLETGMVSLIRMYIDQDSIEEIKLIP